MTDVKVLNPAAGVGRLGTAAAWKRSSCLHDRAAGVDGQLSGGLMVVAPRGGQQSGVIEHPKSAPCRLNLRSSPLYKVCACGR